MPVCIRVRSLGVKVGQPIYLFTFHVHRSNNNNEAAKGNHANNGCRQSGKECAAIVNRLANFTAVEFGWL